MRFRLPCGDNRVRGGARSRVAASPLFASSLRGRLPSLEAGRPPWCSLKLKKTGLYVLSCEGRAAPSGTAVSTGPPGPWPSRLRLDSSASRCVFPVFGLRMRASRTVHTRSRLASVSARSNGSAGQSRKLAARCSFLTPEHRCSWGARPVSRFLRTRPALWPLFCRCHRTRANTEPRRVAYGLEFLGFLAIIVSELKGYDRRSACRGAVEQGDEADER